MHKSLPGLLLGLCLQVQAQQYTVSTVAGGAPPAAPAPALGASVGVTNAVAADSSGNWYFTGGQNVFKVDSHGVLTVFAGNSRRGYSGDGGLAIHAQLFDPFGVAVDAAGNVYVADELNNRIRRVSPDGIIVTVAGSGAAGFSGDGGAAVDAALHYPLNVAVDAAGNLYIGDSFNNRIRRVTPAGIISTFAGGGSAIPGDGGAATAAVLAGPSGMSFDAQGNMFVAERYGMRVRKISPQGVISTVAGTGVQGSGGDGGAATSAQLYLPSDVAEDTDGTLYVADSGNNRIRKVGADGTISTLAPGNGPTGVALDPAGNLLFADRFNHLIQRISAQPNNSVVVVAGNLAESFSGDGGPAAAAQLNLPDGVAVDGLGNVFIADQLNGRIRKVTASGLGSVGAITTPASGLTNPRWIALDAAGNLYVSNLNQVLRISQTGTVTSVAGTGVAGFSGDGGSAANAQLMAPGSIAVDPAGNLYIADTGNQRIRQVSPNGTINTVAAFNYFAPESLAVDRSGVLYYSVGAGLARLAPGGTATLVSTAAGLDFSSLAVDAAGNIYAADSGANQIRRIAPDGTSTVIAGTGAVGYWGDGGAATGAAFYGPLGIAVDGTGKVYVADTLNSAVRVLQPANAPLIVSAVVDAASESVAAVSPGKIVVIYGAGFGSGVAVTFNGFPATVLYSSATQIGVVAPYALTGPTAQMLVVFQGQLAQPFAVAVAATAPDLFTVNQTGAGQAAAINVSDGTLNGAANPVKAGQYIALFATGEGQTSPAGVDGALGGPIAAHPVAAVSVTVGGVPATVQYAGGVSGVIAGLMQINVLIPAGVPVGGYVPVVVKVGSAVSNAGTWIAVAN
jgi:uncharacterized protein (TIGR03437 family)